MPFDCPSRPDPGSAGPSHRCPGNEIPLSQPAHIQSPGAMPQRSAETLSALSQIQINGLAPVHAVPPQESSNAVNQSIPQPSQAKLPDTWRQAYSSTPPCYVERRSAHYHDSSLSHAAHPDTDTCDTVNPLYRSLYHGHPRDPPAGQVAEPALHFAQPSLVPQRPVSVFLSSNRNRSWQSPN
jgi:hypothetical protein